MKGLSVKKSDLALYLEMLLLFRILSIDGIAKYLIFLTWAVLKIIKYNKKICCNKWIIMLPQLFCCLYGGILSIMKGAAFTTIKEMGFVTAPAFAVCVIFSSKGEKRAEKYIDAIFYAIVTLFFIDGFRHYNEIDLLESTYAFALGVYTMLYLYKKEYRRMTLAAVCTLLANKRIVLGAMAVCICFLLFFLRKKHGQKNCNGRLVKFVRVIAVVSTVSALFCVYLIRSNLLSIFMNVYNINSNGRLTIWNYFSQYYTFGLMYFGLGLGKVQVLLDELGNVYFGRLHCDILMYYIELGFVGFVAYIYSHFVVILSLIKKNIVEYKPVLMLVTLLIYTFLCYCTDNIAIYIHYLFPYYMIFESLVFSKELNLEKNIS